MARQRLRLAWAAALLAFLAFSVGAHPRVASAAAPDFSLSTNYGQPYSGILFPGELWDPHPQCHDCVTYGGPHYAVGDGFGGCYLDYNFLTIMPSNGFNAPVTLSVSGLPAGVTSHMPTAVMIPGPGYPFEGDFALEASSSVSLGTTFTVTLTATSGSLVHTITRTVTVSDQVPAPCNNSPGSPWAPLTFNADPVAELTQNQVITVRPALNSPAPAGGTVVTFTSSDPSVVSAPASVTIPAGRLTAPVQISAHPVSSWTQETITASANGNTISHPYDVSPPSSAETVTIRYAQYDSSTGNLLVLANDPNYAAVAALTVLDACTNKVIGAMNSFGNPDGFGAVLPVAPEPATIRVVSSITGASATATLTGGCPGGGGGGGGGGGQ